MNGKIVNRMNRLVNGEALPVSPARQALALNGGMAREGNYNNELKVLVVMMPRFFSVDYRIEKAPKIRSAS